MYVYMHVMYILCHVSHLGYMNISSEHIFPCKHMAPNCLKMHRIDLFLQHRPINIHWLEIKPYIASRYETLRYELV